MQSSLANSAAPTAPESDQLIRSTKKYKRHFSGVPRIPDSGENASVSRSPSDVQQASAGGRNPSRLSFKEIVAAGKNLPPFYEGGDEDREADINWLRSFSETRLQNCVDFKSSQWLKMELSLDERI
ncbi:unnamed protein product [Linum trigynum]|uniref:Uncharacterized protein n=1 Tax=Linum trigynum TaxID=586398 RepID=A0AAV2FN50_9ROSI